MLKILHEIISDDRKRNQKYAAFLRLCSEGKATLNDIVRLGEKLMRSARLHHHFFGDYSLLSTAASLANYVVAQPNTHPLTVSEAIDIFKLFERRIVERIPVPYITSEAEYCGRPFFVNTHVLVPRSIMSTRFEDFMRDIFWENYRVLDLCTGSGCIGITLALMNPKITVDLADISADALAVAQINIQKHAVGDRVKCIQSNLFEQVTEKYDLIITNPPYVSRQEYQSAPAEFKNEPKIALESGKDGLDILHQILRQSASYLNSNGLLIAEVGYTAAKRLKKQYTSIPFQWFKYRRPNGKESWFGMDGVFLCHQSDLPAILK